MDGNDFFMPVSLIRSQLEQTHKVTIFDGPAGTLTQLPAALGGDPTQWPKLTVAAGNSVTPFFELLKDKATYLMLPKSIITALDKIGKVYLTEASVDAGDRGETIPDVLPPRLVEIRIPGASAELAQAGYIFGRDIGFIAYPSVYYQILEIVYHEMTHAWFDLQEFSDAQLQAIWAEGVDSYREAKGVSGTNLGANPGKAFSEAAAYYVSDRIVRWLSALNRLDVALRVKMSDRDFVQTDLQRIVTDYDKYVPVYGMVDNEEIDTPGLSGALREAINEKVLDGLPLTKIFEETPLVALHDAVLNA